MKKVLFLLTPVFAFINVSKGQGGSMCFHDSVTTIHYLNGYLYKKVLGFHVDEKGNSYACGYFYENANTQLYNMFIEKFDRQGHIVWYKEQNFTLYANASIFTYRSSFCSAITTDPFGNIYITGTVASGDFLLDALTFSSNNNYSQGYVAKLDSNGVAQWLIHIDQPPNYTNGISGTDIVYCYPDKLFYSTAGGGITTFANNTSLTIGSGSGISIVEIGTDGNYRKFWGGPYGGPSGPQCWYNPDISSWINNRVAAVSPKIAVAPNGKIVIAGKFLSQLYVNSSLIINASTSGENGYICLLDTSIFPGNCNSGFITWGTQEDYQPGSGLTQPDIIPTLALDSSGFIYVSDRWGVTGPSSLKINNQVLPGTSGAVIAKFSQAGALQWYNQNNFSFIRSLDNNSKNQIVFYGEFPDTLRIKSQSLPDTLINSVGDVDLFWGALDTNGNRVHVETLGSIGTERAYFMDNHNCNENIYFIAIQDTFAVFQNDTFPYNGNVGMIAKYTANNNCTDTICKLPPPPSNSGISDHTPAFGNLKVSPNPSSSLLRLELQGTSFRNGTLVIYNTLGEKCFEKEINGTIPFWVLDISSFTDGMYFISVEQNKQILSAKFIKN